MNVNWIKLGLLAVIYVGLGLAAKAAEVIEVAVDTQKRVAAFGVGEYDAKCGAAGGQAAQMRAATAAYDALARKGGSSHSELPVPVGYRWFVYESDPIHFGWSIGTTKEQAEAGALANYHQRAGSAARPTQAAIILEITD